MHPTNVEAPCPHMSEVRPNLNEDAVFIDPESVQPDVVSGVVSVRLEPTRHLEVVFAEAFFDLLPECQPSLPQVPVKQLFDTLPQGQPA